MFPFCPSLAQQTLGILPLNPPQTESLRNCLTRVGTGRRSRRVREGQPSNPTQLPGFASGVTQLFASTSVSFSSSSKANWAEARDAKRSKSRRGFKFIVVVGLITAWLELRGFIRWVSKCTRVFFLLLSSFTSLEFTSVPRKRGKIFTFVWSSKFTLEKFLRNCV